MHFIQVHKIVAPIRVNSFMDILVFHKRINACIKISLYTNWEEF